MTYFTECDVPLPKARISNVNQKPSRVFGREGVLWRMEKACFYDNQEDGYTKVYILNGIGGVGKTTIGEKFAKDHEERHASQKSVRIGTVRG
jgi:flagellar biosynthesis GTPase FlhF